MKIRTKIFLGYFLAAATALYFMMEWVKNDVRTRYLESIEENMVDTANILACLVPVDNGKIKLGNFDEIFHKVHKRIIAAKIYDVTKTSVDTQIYITNKAGIVLFDSGNPGNIGKDFSAWRDIYFTLRGKYGARATRIVKDKPSSLVMHVSAPILYNKNIIGVLTVYKPVNFVTLFIRRAEKRIVTNTLWAFVIVVLLGILISAWLTNPVLKLKKYVDTVKKGKKTVIPSIGGGEIAGLAQSFEEMREALEGKKYVEEYVRNLTHELKSPLSGIQGALELLSEKDIPSEQKEKFLHNIEHEILRMRSIVDRMLLLSKLENIKTIEEKEDINIIEVLKEITSTIKTTSLRRKIIFEVPDKPIVIKGDKFLIYEAFDNIIRNSIDFTDNDGEISISIEQTSDKITVIIADDGAGIPDYAITKVFDKFYSLPRPGKKEKSSGLGLSITREIIELHGGNITVTHNEKQKKGTMTLVHLTQLKTCDIS